MIGQTVSHYRIVTVIGSGGMSVVYKAQDVRLGRFVALKFLLEKFCRNRESLERFQQEARAASALNHPGICTIYDIDHERDRPFIVMEYLHGQTLRHILRQRGITMREAVACGIRVADALSQAHEAGIVHRDVSPANVFVTRDGRVKLLDFGLAKLMSPDGRNGRRAMDTKNRRLTLTGTIHYMSPEQAQSQEVDARSDIFSLGVVMYELLSGRRPFGGPNMIAILSEIAKATPESLGSIVPNLPPAVLKAVDRCLQKRPEARYQNAAELCWDLKCVTTAASLESKIRVKTSVSPSYHSARNSAFSAATIPESTSQRARDRHSFQ
jgi:serine/threonine protein kinase